MARQTEAEHRSQARRYQERRKWIDAIKLESGCADCGYKSHPAALDFDHIRGQKQFNIAHNMLRRWQDVLTEIAKCEVVCANCHRVRTDNRRYD